MDFKLLIPLETLGKVVSIKSAKAPMAGYKPPAESLIFALRSSSKFLT